MKENKKINEKAEDFVGWKSEDGTLEVIEILPRIPYKEARYKVTCTECSKDPELFQDGYFISTKSNLIKGAKPCGCAKIPKWKDWQFLILARRAGEGKFIVHGFAEKFHGHKTKLNIECIKDGNKWTTSVNCVMNKQGCPKCKNINSSEQQKTPEHIAIERCISICNKMNYKPVGFVGSYNGAVKTIFEYVCPKHGKQSVIYNKFVNSGNRCGDCAKAVRSGNGYYPERKDEQDFLYVLNFDDKYIKVGRSFDVDERIKELRKPSSSGIKNIIKLRIYTATHQEIWDLEQELLDDLRERGFQHHLSWTNECFDNDCVFVLNKFLDTCDFKRIY